MKRFLAAVLTLSMCLSIAGFIPTASATDAEPTVYDLTVTKNNTNFTGYNAQPWYTADNWEGFDFSDKIKAFSKEYMSGNLTEWTFDNDVTYHATDTFTNENGTYENYESLKNTHIRLLQMYTTQLYFGPSVSQNLKVNGKPVYTFNPQMADQWVALKLKAPTTRGMHELTVNWNSSTYVANGCDIFFAPYVEGQNDGDYYINNGEKVCENKQFRYSTATTDTFEKKVNIGEASHYILIFKLNGKGATNRIYLKSITLTPVEDETAAPTEISYGVFDNIEGFDAVTVSGGEENKLLGTVAPGTGITATANAKEGYTFRYWVLGSAATGRYYSSEPTVTVKPYANLALTAIYTEANEETKYLDFFNWNGEFIAGKEVEGGKVTDLPTATLTGYNFAHWLLDNNVTQLTNDNYANTEIPDGVSKAMAQYTADGSYDTPVQNKDSVTGWTRNGNLVTYSKDYEFFTWLNAVGTIAAYTGEEISDEIPLAVLESDGGDNFMLEYDKGVYTIKEAGILFGKTEKVNVTSAYSKATVKNFDADGHGQLTTAPVGDEDMELYARGYVMYGDKVIYTDVIAVNYSK